jgi:hypothetical protein
VPRNTTFVVNLTKEDREYLNQFIILNTPQLCCGDEHETDLRLVRALCIDDRINACKPLCLSNQVSYGLVCQI